MRLGMSRRLFVIILAATFAWPVPAIANDPPTPTAAPTVEPTPRSTPASEPARSEAPTAPSAPTTESPPPASEPARSEAPAASSAPTTESPPPASEPARSEAPAASSAPTTESPPPASTRPTPSDPGNAAPPGPDSDRTANPAAPNRDALDTSQEGGGGDDTISTLACSGAIIDNGFIQLGIHPEGHLNVPCGSQSAGDGSGNGTTNVGLRYMPDNTEATAPGCLCEGWGAADATTGVTGYANVAVDGVVNLQVQQFSSGASLASSRVQIGTTLDVTHEFRLSPIDELYEVAVSIKNISSQSVDLRYRRVMDWDIEPTAFDEFVTIERGTSPAVAYTSNNGFATANPLGGRPGADVDPFVEGSFTDIGPTDHGALFDFDFGALPPGERKTFSIYYGAAADEIDALGAIGQVQAEAYSLGQPSTAGGPTLGTPNTFIFAFRGLTEVEPAPPGTELNGHPNSGLSADPVHTFSGSFTHAEQDLVIPGRGPAIALQRTYNSNDSRVGPLGTGWMHSYAMRLSDTGDGSGDLVLVGSQGRSDRYTRNADGTFAPPDAIHTALVQEGDGTYTASHKDRSAWRFDAGGRLIALIDRHGNSSELTYDAAGPLAAISDPAGRGSLTLTYTDGLLTSVTDWLSPARTVTYAYDADDRLATVTDRAGKLTTYGYDGTTHRLTTITDANGNVQVSNTYDAAGRVVRQQDARGLTSGAETTFGYTDNADGTRTTVVTYPPAAFEPTFAPTQTHVHNADGWLLSETRRPSSTETHTTTFSYDAAGNRSSVTDPRGNSTSFCYDVDATGAAIAGSRGNLTRRIDPPPSAGADPLVTLIEYDNLDNVTRLVPPRGVDNGSGVTCGSDLSAAVDADFATELAYDSAGAELRSVSQRATDPTAGLLTSVTRFEYADAANPGLVTRVVPPRGNTGASPDYAYATTYTYAGSGSQAGMLTSVSDPLGNSTTFAYDAVGRRTSVVDANGNAAGADPAAHTTSYEYDAEDRPRFISLPAPTAGGDELVTEFRYDPVGKRTIHIDAAGQVIRYSFDERNDLERVEHSPSAWTDPAVTPADVIVTSYAYDDAMQLTRITRADGDAAERATAYAHDGLGRLRVETQYPAWPATTGPLVSTFTYDANGNLASRSDPLGQTTGLAHDALNRLTAVDHADAGTADVAYTYDLNGNRLSMVDGTGTTTYAYDELDRLLTVTTLGSVSVGYRYDLDGNRARLIYPGDDDLAYSYDTAGRLTSLTDWDARVTEYAYRPAGSLAGVAAVNGTTTNFEYDNALRLAEVLHTGAGGSTLEQLSYTLDAVGNVTAIAEGAGDPSAEPTTARVSVASDGTQASAGAVDPALSGDGRFVAFHSAASNLVAGDTNGVTDVFVHDRATGDTRRVSLSSAGAQAAEASDDAWLSADGGVVVFRSQADTLVAGDTHTSGWDTFAHELASGVTSMVSRSSGGAMPNGTSGDAVVSADGRFVAFSASASNLVAGDSNATWDVFVHDRDSGTTQRVSLASDGTQANAGSEEPSISADGRYVAFWSDASNLVAGDTNARRDVFVHDRDTGTTSRVSLSSAGAQANQLSDNPLISADGTTVAFWSDASNLVAGDTNARDDVFVHVRASGLTSRVSVSSSGGQGSKGSSDPAISADGRHVAFKSSADNLVSGDSNNRNDAFVRDRDSGTTTRVSLSAAGGQANDASTNVAISDDGATVAFESVASNLVSGDTNALVDVFVRGAAFGASSLTTYSYDRLSRLTGADGPSGDRGYAYDPVGNRLEMVRDATATAYAYDTADRLTSVGGSAVTVDAAGNLTTRGSDAFTYHAANRLLSATSNGATQTSTYDGDGTRVATSVGSTTTGYVHDVAAGLPLIIDDGTRRYVWGPAGLAYSVDTASGALEVVHADHLGSVRTSTDATGSVTASARYDEFGVPLDTTGASDSPFGFTGEPTDPTGLVHLRARSYDPSLGRFLNRDPWAGVTALPSSLNRYTYVANNPLRYADPSGKNPCAAFAAALAGGPPGWAVGGGGALICTVIVVGLGAAVVGPAVAQNPPDIDISIDLSDPRHPEDFEYERHLETLRNLYQWGDNGRELQSGLWNPCRERGPRCDAARALAGLTIVAIVLEATRGEGDITQTPYNGIRPKNP
jgi:RHS repeat-associated protein